MDFWFEGEAKVDPLMKSFIESVRAKGLKCFLATNNEKYRTEYLWNNVGIKNFLDGLFSSCYLRYMKPDVKYWETLFQDLKGVEKNEIILWDDKEGAIHSAREFGFNAEFY